MKHLVSAMLIALTLAACGDEESTGPGQTLPPAVVSVVVTPASAALVSLGETVQLTASALDANGNTISGKTFTWSSSDESLAIVSSSGEVTAVANGSVTITATTDGVNGTAAIQVDQGAAELVFTVQPTATLAGAATNPAVEVTIQDAFGNTVTAATDAVTVAIGTNPSGGTLSGTLVATPSAGVATFSDLAIDKTGDGYDLTATASGVTGATSSSFNITPAAASLLAFTVQPNDARAGVALTPAVEVSALDPFGNVATSFTGSVTVALRTNPSAGTPSGTLTVAAVAGVAAFSDLSIDRLGDGYDLRASAAGLTGATSDPFNITGTIVTGVISESTTWTVAGAPYVVTGNILVPAGVTLTIEPGVSVLFSDFYYIKVEGTFIAIGTGTDAIVFTSAQNEPQAGDWSRIWFTSTSVDATVDASGNYLSGSAIAYAVISYGGQIQFDASSPYFANNHVHHVTGTPPRDWPNGAIWTCNSGSIIRDNIIEDNPLSGIVVLGGAVKIQGNIIRRNTGYWGGGIFFANPNCVQGASGTALVEDNQITENTATFGGGMALYSGSPKIWHNDIKNNVATGTLTTGDNAQGNGAAIALFSGGGPEITYNNIENNLSTASGQSAAFFFSSSFSGIIQHNNLANPTTYEIYLNSNLTNDIDAMSNFWNTTLTAEIDARIWDDRDDFELGVVAYTPILMSPETTAGPRN